MSVRPLPPGHTREPLAEQTARLARFICDEVPGEPSQSQGAVDTAIRVMRELLADRQAVRDLADELDAESRDTVTCRTDPAWGRGYTAGLEDASLTTAERIRCALGGAS